MGSDRVPIFLVLLPAPLEGLLAVPRNEHKARDQKCDLIEGNERGEHQDHGHRRGIRRDNARDHKQHDVDVAPLRAEGLYPLLIPTTSMPLYIAVLTTLLIAAFIPGASPPLVKTLQ